jgi:hypothetical protein
MTVHIDSTMTGRVLRLGNDSLAIGVVKLDDRVLIVTGNQLSCLDETEIAERPARCVTCGGSRWWFMADNYPICGQCQPSSAEERAAIWEQAYMWFHEQRSDLGAICLEFFFRHDRPANWPQIQAIAFGARAVDLIRQWREDHETYA